MFQTHSARRGKHELKPKADMAENQRQEQSRLDQQRWNTVLTWRKLRGETKLAWKFLSDLTHGRLGSVVVHPGAVAGAQGSNDSRTGARLLERLADRGLIDIIDSNSYPWTVYVHDPLELKKRRFRKISADPQGELALEEETEMEEPREEAASVRFPDAPQEVPDLARRLQELLKSDKPADQALVQELLDRLQNRKMGVPHQAPDVADVGPAGVTPSSVVPNTPEPPQTPSEEPSAPHRAPDVEPHQARDVETPMSTSDTSKTLKIPICALSPTTSEDIGVSTSGARCGAAIKPVQTIRPSKTPGPRLTASEVPPGCEPLEKNLLTPE